MPAARPPPPRALAQEPLVPSEDGRIDRLVLAAAQQIAERGAAGASARSIAAAAGCAPSAINYNFGNLERLFSATFDHGRAQARAWLDQRAIEIAALPATRAGAPLALQHLVVEWTRAARPLALLYQEDLSTRAGQAPSGWTRLWRDFWLETAPRFGLDETEGRLLHLIFEGEALYHLSGWSPALEQAALGEICAHLGEVWLDAGPGAPRGALALAERTAGVISADAIAPAAFKVAEAAAGVIDERGVGGLTHRAVAARAGVTTGAVTHHFRTIEDLVAGAIRGQVILLAKRASAPSSAATPVDDIRTLDQFAAAVRPYVTGPYTTSKSRIDRRGLFLAAVRRPDLARAGAVIRFAHGSSTKGTLGRIYDLDETTLALHAGLVSRLLSSIPLACADAPAPDTLGATLVDEITARLGAFQARR